MAKLRVVVNLGLVGAHKVIEREINLEALRQGDEKLYREALDSCARDLLFTRLIEWEWSLLDDNGEPVT